MQRAPMELQYWQEDQFQSSPVPEDGCNGQFPTQCGWIRCFNPHPSRRTGATAGRHVRNRRGNRCFNPHPSRRTGATGRGRMVYGRRLVSILTRPGGRVQPELVPDIVNRFLFQSSPVPEDGCNTASQSGYPSSAWFQSSPVPEDGCNRGTSVRGRCGQ